MTQDDNPVLRRSEAFNRENCGGVSVYRSRGGKSLAFTATQVPIARFRPAAGGDGMRLCCWSWQGRRKDVGDMGSQVMPLDGALAQIASTEVFRSWT